MSVKDKLVELIFGSLCKHIHKSCNLAENIADDLIANDVTVQQWIPVSERPKEAAEYCVMIEGNEKASSLWYSKCYDGWFDINDDGYTCSFDVTHWMPLPEPPKGAQE